MTLYTYKQKINIGNDKIHVLFGVKENKITSIFEKFAYLLEWFSIGFLFYLNSTYIHSKLFALFVFVVGIALLGTLKLEKKISTKEEFLKRVNDMLGENND